MSERLEGSPVECPKLFLLDAQVGTVTRSVVIPFLKFGDRPVVEKGGASFIELEPRGTHGGGLTHLLSVVDHDRSAGEGKENCGYDTTHGHSMSTPVLSGGDAALIVIFGVAKGVVADKTRAGQGVEIVGPP